MAFLTGGDEGVPLFTEANPILHLALDSSGSCASLWVATTATHVNKWPVDPSRLNGFVAEGMGQGEVSSEEEEGVTYIDDAEPTPLFTKPISSLPGIASLPACLVQLFSFFPSLLPASPFPLHLSPLSISPPLPLSPLPLFFCLPPSLPPSLSLPTAGGSSIKEYRVLNNRQQLLTKDSSGEVVLWDVLHVS